MATDRGLAGVAFAEAGEEGAALADMTRRWPRGGLSWRTRPRPRRSPRGSSIRGNGGRTRRSASSSSAAISRSASGRRCSRCRSAAPRPIPTSPATSSVRSAARAVGAAVGRNPLSFVVPCHRVLGRSGGLTGYHWGLTRKRAMLGWEAGVAGGATQRRNAFDGRGARFADGIVRRGLTNLPRDHLRLRISKQPVPAVREGRPCSSRPKRPPIRPR